MSPMTRARSATPFAKVMANVIGVHHAHDAFGDLSEHCISPWVSVRLICSGRGPDYPGPPAQIPACGFPAPGSCRRSNAIEVRGFGGPCTPDPQACDFGYTPHPALSPGRALLLAFPPAGRLPSTISATDLWSALFEASLVLCGRPTPHLSRDGFASSASRRGPAPP
jgi:hypothetical protein